MAWEIIDFVTVTPPNEPNPRTYTRMLNKMTNADMTRLYGDNISRITSYRTIPSLDSFTPVPWGFAGPTILLPVLGTPVTNCGPSGCDGGGGGDTRPPVGLLYPRGATP